MFDHRLAQVTHQEQLNKAAAKRNREAAGLQQNRGGFQKLLASITAIFKVLGTNGKTEDSWQGDDLGYMQR